MNEQSNLNVLVLGSNGMLGHMLSSYLKLFLDYNVIPLTRKDLNAELSTEELRNKIKSYSPNIVVNCIGLINVYANVSEREDEAYTINSKFPHKLLDCSLKDDWKLIHISSDCYLDQDTYGLSKKRGEINHTKALTIRTSIIGPEIKDGYGLFHWFMKQSGEIEGYVNAQWDGVTTLQLSKFIQECIKEDSFGGIIDYRNNESISKYQLLKNIAKIFKKKDLVRKNFKKMKDKRNLKADVFCKKSYMQMLEELKDYMNMSVL